MFFRIDIRHSDGSRTPTVTSACRDWLKQKAREIKRTEGISHTEALDLCARQQGFENWHQVTLAVESAAPTEGAFHRGFVAAFDPSEIQSFEGKEWLYDPALEFYCRDSIRAAIMGWLDEDSDDGQTLGQRLTADEIDERMQDELDNLLFVRYRTNIPSRTPQQWLTALCDFNFFGPRFAWFQGRLINANPYEYAIESEEPVDEESHYEIDVEDIATAQWHIGEWDDWDCSCEECKKTGAGILPLHSDELDATIVLSATKHPHVVLRKCPTWADSNFTVYKANFSLKRTEEVPIEKWLLPLLQRLGIGYRAG